MRRISLISILRNNQIHILDSFLKSQRGRDLEIYDIHLQEIVKNNRLQLLKMLITNKHRKIIVTKLYDYEIFDLLVEYKRYEIADLLFSIMTVDAWCIYCYRLSITDHVLSKKYYKLYEIMRKHNLISVSNEYCQKLFDETDIDQILLLHKDSKIDLSKDCCIGLSFVFNNVVTAISPYYQYAFPKQCELVKKEIIPLLKFNFGFIRILHCMIENNPINSIYDMHTIAYTLRGFLYGF